MIERVDVERLVEAVAEQAFEAAADRVRANDPFDFPRDTGGAARVTSDEFAAAFERVARDSSAMDRFCRDEGIR